ncbi:hypothetical protein [Nonomuraea longicatena]|uniref:Glycosyltransferase RgtA/B/C/D-like domain-containing protein n=1 Tax=Nonomuraea longicatena TaxID=83682 RepID=A0ABN1QPW9_9ACTN
MDGTALLTRPTPTAPAPRRFRALPWLLVVGWGVQLLVRLWITRYSTGPVANPDETGYLLAARLFAGGVGGDMSSHTFYRGGYPLFLVPVFWFTDDSVTAYRAISAIGSAVSAAAFPLAYALLRRLGLALRPALVLGFAAGLSPAVVVFAGLALVDAVLPTLVLAWLLALYDLVDRGTAAPAVACGLLSGLALSIHLRGTIVFVTFVLAVTALLILRRLPRPAALWALGSAALAAGLGLALNAHLAATLYSGGTRDLSGQAMQRMTSLDGQARALAGAAGQIWYLGVGTWGLAALGLVAALALLVRTLLARTLLIRARGSAVPGRLALLVVAAALLIVTLGIAYTSAAALPDEHRVGNYVYGRYLAAVAVPWTVAGIAVLARAARRAVLAATGAAAALTVAMGALAAWHAGDRLTRYTFIAFDFPEVIFLTRLNDRLDLGRTMAIALLLLAGLAAAAIAARTLTRRQWGTALLAAALAVPNLAFVAHLAPKAAPSGPGWLPEPPRHGPVAIAREVHWGVHTPMQWFVSWSPLQRFEGDTPPADACSAIVKPDAAAPPQGWTLVRRSRHWQLWTRSGCQT